MNECEGVYFQSTIHGVIAYREEMNCIPRKGDMVTFVNLEHQDYIVEHVRFVYGNKLSIYVFLSETH